MGTIESSARDLSSRDQVIYIVQRHLTLLQARSDEMHMMFVCWGCETHCRWSYTHMISVKIDTKKRICKTTTLCLVNEKVSTFNGRHSAAELNMWAKYELCAMWFELRNTSLTECWICENSRKERKKSILMRFLIINGVTLTTVLGEGGWWLKFFFARRKRTNDPVCGRWEAQATTTTLTRPTRLETKTPKSIHQVIVGRCESHSWHHSLKQCREKGRTLFCRRTANDQFCLVFSPSLSPN